jgi:hypothetical protein
MPDLPNPFQFVVSESTTDDAAAASQPVSPAAAAADYIPEPFSEVVARRSMAIVSPPRPKTEPRAFEPDFDALYDAIVPPEPPPVFLRNPSQAFERLIFELSN